MPINLLKLFTINLLLGIGTAFAAPLGFQYEILQFPGNPLISETAISNSGDIVATPNGPTSFLRSHDGTFTSFGFPGSPATSALGINAAGVIVGDYLSADGSYSSAYIRHPDGTFTPFNGFPGSRSVARGISDNGYIVGESNGPNATLPGLWIRNPDGTFEALNSPNDSSATDVNDSLQLAQGPGIASQTTGNFDVIRYPGADSTTIKSINNHGDTAGYASVFVPEPGGGGFDSITPFFRSAGGTFVDLAVPGALNVIPQSINDNGVIVGILNLPADTPDRFFLRAFMATPVPEPSSCAILMVGLAVLGLTKPARTRAWVPGCHASEPGELWRLLPQRWATGGPMRSGQVELPDRPS